LYIIFKFQIEIEIIQYKTFLKRISRKITTYIPSYILGPTMRQTTLKQKNRLQVPIPSFYEGFYEAYHNIVSEIRKKQRVSYSLFDRFENIQERFF